MRAIFKEISVKKNFLIAVAFMAFSPLFLIGCQTVQQTLQITKKSDDISTYNNTFTADENADVVFIAIQLTGKDEGLDVRWEDRARGIVRFEKTFFPVSKWMSFVYIRIWTRKPENLPELSPIQPRQTF